MSALALFAACAREPQTKRVTLPGFSIELPAGKVVATSRAASGGKHELDIEPSLMSRVMFEKLNKSKLVVEWSAGGSTHEEWTQQFLPLLVAAIEPTIKGSRVLRDQKIDEHHWVSIVGSQLAPIGVGMADCDDAFTVTVTYALYRNLERQLAALRDVVESVRCSSNLANVVRPVAATRLPIRFGRIENADAQQYRSIEGDELIVTFTVGDIQHDKTIYRTLIKAMISTAFETRIEETQLDWLPAPRPPLAHQASLMHATLAESPRHVYVGAIHCPDLGQTLISFWEPMESNDPLAYERLRQVGCPDEESTTTPDFKSLVEQACAAGDVDACDWK